MARVLIVDDEPGVVLLLTEVLRDEGHMTLGAATAAEGLELTRAHEDLDVALVDKNLPDGSGLDVVREFKRLRPDGEAILMTAYASLSSAIEALRLAAHDYLVKPFDDLHLVALKVNNAADLVRLRRERKTLEEELSYARKMEALGRMASGVAHDFNNLLSIVLNSATFLLDELPQHPGVEQAIQDVLEIKHAAESGARVTHQLLAFSRREVVPPDVVEVNLALGRMRSLVERSIGPGIAIDLALGQGAGAVRIPSVHLERILINLAINARDAMPEGGRLRITTEPVVDAMGVPRWTRLTVSDTGLGMSPETRSRVFEPFFTTKPPGKGTGLGLATVYGLVQQAGGSIAVESAPGLGTRFEIKLPLTEEQPAIEVAAAGSGDLAGRREVVLLVEDDGAVRATIRRMLLRGGYRVIDAPAGDDALAMLRAGRDVDLLLTDVTMPQMPGDALAAEAQQARPGLPVVFMSGSLFDTSDLRRFGPAFLAKPFTEAQLLAMLRRVLGAPAQS